jgi:two-component system cell cycle sensor histidine kinase/response regulator CckA
MSEKPSFEELQQKVEELEKKVITRYRPEDEFEQIFNLSLDMIGSGNLDGYFTKINSSFETILGYAPKDFLSQQFISFVHVQDVEKTKAALAEAINGKTNIYIENRYKCKDGSYKWIDWKVLSIKQDNKFIAVGRDITERKKTEQALLESQEKYKTIIESIEDGYYEVDIAGNFTFFNESMCRILGYSKDELTGLNNRRYMDEENAKKVFKAFNEVYETGEPYKAFDWELIGKNGSRHFIEASVAPKKDSEGHIIGFQGIARDMTEHKQAERALHASEVKFRTLVEKSPLGISLIGKNGRYKHINPQFTKIFGYTIEDIPTGAAWFKKSFPDKDYRQKVIQTWIKDQRRVNIGQARPRIFMVICKDGSQKEIFFRQVMIENRDQLVIYEDITEKTKMEHQFQQAQKFEAIGTLAGGLAHDFNNLLMGIQGRASLMAADLGTSHPHAEHLDAIEKYIRSAVNLTKQLLGFARGGKYEVKPVDINELVLNSATLFGRTRKEIQIHTKLQPSLLVIEADQRQIEQVFLNLYVNAWQAMLDGGDLYLETKTAVLDHEYCKHYDAMPGSYAKISVTDTGVGMDEATRRRVFDPFFTTKGKRRGAGLGLASAFGIIKNHNGIITVYSEVGYGATFNIYLPLSDEAVQHTPPTTEKLVRGSETVLLVDDEELIIEVGQAMLERLGYRVWAAHSGEQALEMVAKMEDAIDLVILDMIMPGMDGGRAFDRIRKIRADLPVILSSGYSINGKANDIMQRGCNGFIQKPFNLSELSQKIRSILDGPNPIS